MAKIQVLDKHVSELIAAGEVVERPASVVKEMMENSIDAGAKHITVEIRDGGITFIRLEDDGCGFSRDDVPTAFLRHATSKVRSETDLLSIHTLGFRGEALASIAAVSQVELTTCAAGEMVGTHYVIRGGEEVLLEDAGCPEGSVFVIRDLFYNIPARMKFLKKDVSEGNAVAGVVEQIALSHPEIAVTFIRNGRTDVQTAGNGDLLSCIRSVFGKPFAAGLVPVDYTANGVKVNGFICKPEACRSNRTMQHYFVNGRYVRSQTALVALERAYKGVMMVGRFPCCVLFMTLPPETVDVNVHPAKIEVRFINEKPVFEAVFYGVKSALESHHSFQPMPLREEKKPTAPVTSAPQQRSFFSEPARPKPVVAPPAVKPVVREPKAPSFLDITVDDDDRPAEASLEDGTLSAYVPAAFRPAEKPIEPIAEPSAPEKKPEEPISAAPEDEPIQQQMEEKPAVRIVGEAFSTYIIAQMEEDLYFIDKHAAHERLLYDQLKENARSDAQMLLEPVTVTVSRDEHTALMENQELFRQAGILLEDFGGRTVLVRSFPLRLAGEDIAATIQEMTAHLAGGRDEIVTEKLDWIYHSTACRAAIKGGDVVSAESLQSLAERVLTQNDVRFCPHGRPVCFCMSRKDLEKQFGRTR